jgi:UDP-N-acetylmuramoyl-L-alanyl-D-glutamate--2,6-diaminopimelate ligase
MSATLLGLIEAFRRDGLLLQAPQGELSLSGVSADSRVIEPGMLYVAVRGSQADGHRFVAEAVRRGAAAVVVEVPQGISVPEIVVRDGRSAALVAGRLWYGNPTERLSLVGVTGTNGKTTTTALVRHLLNAEGHAGSIGTLGAFDGAGEPVSSTAGTLTTPGPIDLQATMAALVERGVTYVAMETSSHSLDQGRLDGLTFAAAVFTNLTRDHLDYHQTMEAYLAAKLRLSGYLALDGVEVVNLDDPAWRVMPPRPRRLTFGMHPAAMVRAEEVQLESGGSIFRLVAPQGHGIVRLPLLGEFNVYNALGAAGAAVALAVPFSRVVERLGSAPQVPGRMERVSERPCVVLRDYAHTPDALERALTSLRPLTAGGSSSSSAAAAIETGASAPSWAAWRRSWRISPSSPPTIPAPRTPTPSSPKSSRACGGRPISARWTAGQPSPWRSNRPGRATHSSSLARDMRPTRSSAPRSCRSTSGKLSCNSWAAGGER